MLTFHAMAQAFGVAPATQQFSEAPTEPLPRVEHASAGSPSASSWRARAAARDVAMRIPAMRRAHNVIVGTCSTFTLAGWAGTTRLPETDARVGWLRQPDPERTLFKLLCQTFDDGLWEGRCVWNMRRDLALMPTRHQRVHPRRYSSTCDHDDPDTVTSWTVDGKLLTPAEFARDYLVFDFAPLGGLRQFGYELLELYADLQAAAGNYARAPHPKAILRNHGAELTDEEVDDLLAEWNMARAYSSVGYLDDEMDYDVQDGWSPEQMQLVESREHTALEVARLVGIPAYAIDAKSGESMTYSNTVEKRRDLLEALRPWLTVVEQTLSMDDRSGTPKGRVLPLGIRARFDVDAFTRNDPLVRMQTWETARRGGILTGEEIRAAEPLATTDGPAPEPLPTQQPVTPTQEGKA